MNESTSTLPVSSTSTQWWDSLWAQTERSWGNIHYYLVAYLLPSFFVVGIIENGLCLMVWLLILQHFVYKFV